MPQFGFHLRDVRVRGAADKVTGAEVPEPVGHAIRRRRPTDDQRAPAETAGPESLRDARVRQRHLHIGL